MFIICYVDLDLSTHVHVACRMRTCTPDPRARVDAIARGATVPLWHCDRYVHIYIHVQPSTCTCTYKLIMDHDYDQDLDLRACSRSSPGPAPGASSRSSTRPNQTTRSSYRACSTYIGSDHARARAARSTASRADRLHDDALTPPTCLDRQSCAYA